MNKTSYIKDLLDPDFLATFRPETVYVLAPGPNGADFWNRIPDNAFVIAVNKAIELIDKGTVRCQRHLWLVPELSAQRTSWFPQFKDKYRDSLCIGSALKNPGGMEEDEYFKYFDYWGSEPCQDVQLEIGKLCTYGTVSSMAMQLAYYLGAIEIILVGVDMFGDEYYDGTKGFYEGMREGTPWHNHINGFNELIRAIKSKGILVSTLSPTKLELDNGS